MERERVGDAEIGTGRRDSMRCDIDATRIVEWHRNNPLKSRSHVATERVGGGGVGRASYWTET
ncbi:hypothetical protein Mapa_001173 [Marchantia paleacea]|nr:hypothetical protein Mapa_001173 [Marchantia paleacea]